MLDLSHLNKAQKEAVCHKNGPLLLVAGAGTGKTTVITNRVAWLIDQGLAKPDEILCLTFTDKAAGEMEERIDKLLPYGYVDLWVMTFHAFCERLLHLHGIEIGLPSDFRILDQTSQWMLMHDHLDQFDLEYYKPLGKPTKFVSAMLTHFSRAKDEGLTPEGYLDYAENLQADLKSSEAKDFLQKLKSEDQEEQMELWKQEISRRKEIAKAYAKYQEILLEQGALDFGDLILSVKTLFEKRPALLKQYQQYFKYILVDEFQDTNWAQYELVRMLSQASKNIMVVGDDDQSIYKFRGASLSNILGFKSDYPDSRQIVLTENYRSTQDILDLAYGFIQHNNPHRLEYQLQNDQELVDDASKRAIDLTGFDSIKKELKAAVKEKGIIEYLHYRALADESAAVISKINELHRKNKDLHWGDFAILVRANGSAEPFLQQLALAEIPYQFLASQGLFSQPVILDLISYLKLLDNYAESTALYRLLILPTVDISNDDLMKLLYEARKQGTSLLQAVKSYEGLDLTSKGKEKCRKILSNLEEHANFARSHRVSEVAMAFIDAYELKQYYETLDAMKQKDIYGLLNHFWRTMERFESENSDKSVKQFLDYLQLAVEAGDTGSLPQDVEYGPDTVKIMTIHGAKGLEFEHVFLVNMVDRRFPTIERKDPIELPDSLIQEVTPGENHHLEEERRLCYVALTRAKKGLYLTSAEDYGGARKKKLSRFLLEMGFEKTEAISLDSNLLFGGVHSKSFEVQKAQAMDYTKYLPSKYSFSQLTTYETCPWQYRYAHILRIPVAGKYTTSFGSSLHNALEQFHRFMMEKNKTHVSLDILLNYFEEEWIDEWYPSRTKHEEMKQKGRQFLTDYYNKHSDSWPETFSVEQSFNLKIDGETIKGKIDRIDRTENGGLRLIDYKSSKAKKKVRKEQLFIYQLAIQELFDESVEELTYYYLDGGDEVSFLGKEKDMEKTKIKLISTINEIKSGKFPPVSQKAICQNCDFKAICQFRVL